MECSLYFHEFDQGKLSLFIIIVDIIIKIVWILYYDYRYFIYYYTQL